MKKEYTISDGEGNFYDVKDWNNLFNDVTEDELNDIYVINKYIYSFEEELAELNKGIEKNEFPFVKIANSIDIMYEHIGKEKIKILDEIVSGLLSRKVNFFPPQHLN